MRSRLVLTAVLLIPVLTGCNMLRGNLFGSKGKDYSSTEERPTKEKLVAYLNNEANKPTTLQVNNLAMEAKMGLGAVRSIELRGTLHAQKPRNFRLEGAIPFSRTEVVDLGSNDREFWFWVSGAGRESETPYLYHCSHTDLPKATLPLPIHPDWIMEALGMAAVPTGPNVQMEYTRDKRFIELIEPTRSPSGQTMYKVTVFNARTVTGTEPQIVARKLLDSRHRVICVAEIKEMQQDVHTKKMVPHRMDLIYPSERKLEQISLSLVLDSIAVDAQIDPALASNWFTRPSKPGVVALDLGRPGNNASLRMAPGSPTSGSPLFRGARLR